MHEVADEDHVTAVTCGVERDRRDVDGKRNALDASGWDHEPPPPVLPDDVVEATAAKYREAYERISGETFDTYLERIGAAT
jgi:phosphoribosylaminoimidazole-succinocarboxamide synthase